MADPGFEVSIPPPPPPLRGFPEANIKVYTWIILGFRIAPPPPHEHFSEATIKVYRNYLNFFTISIGTHIFSESTMKVYVVPPPPPPAGSATESGAFNACLNEYIPL